jgi:hypothetical protein
MMMNLLCLLALSCLLGLTALEVPALARLPSNWFIADASLSADSRVTLKLALKPEDPAALERRLLQISTPGSKSFRQYLSKEEIRALVGRSDRDLDRIRTWWVHVHHTHNPHIYAGDDNLCVL